jgi:hypothetical protein
MVLECIMQSPTWCRLRSGQPPGLAPDFVVFTVIAYTLSGHLLLVHSPQSNVTRSTSVTHADTCRSVAAGSAACASSSTPRGLHSPDRLLPALPTSGASRHGCSS